MYFRMLTSVTGPSLVHRRTFISSGESWNSAMKASAICAFNSNLWLQ